MNRTELKEIVEVLDVGTVIEWVGAERIVAHLKGEVYVKPEPPSLRLNIADDIVGGADWMCGHPKVECIKEYRNVTGVGLKEAKDAIEAAMYRAGIGS